MPIHTRGRADLSSDRRAEITASLRESARAFDRKLGPAPQLLFHMTAPDRTEFSEARDIPRAPVYGSIPKPEVPSDSPIGNSAPADAMQAAAVRERTERLQSTKGLIQRLQTRAQLNGRPRPESPTAWLQRHKAGLQIRRADAKDQTPGAANGGFERSDSGRTLVWKGDANIVPTGSTHKHPSAINRPVKVVGFTVPTSSGATNAATFRSDPGPSRAAPSRQVPRTSLTHSLSQLSIELSGSLEKADSAGSLEDDATSTLGQRPTRLEVDVNQRRFDDFCNANLPQIHTVKMRGPNRE